MPGLERPLVLLVLPALFGLLVFFRRTGLLRGPLETVPGHRLPAVQEVIKRNSGQNKQG